MSNKKDKEQFDLNYLMFGIRQIEGAIQSAVLYASFRNTQAQQVEKGAFIDGYLDFREELESRQVARIIDEEEAA